MDNGTKEQTMITELKYRRKQIKELQYEIEKLTGRLSRFKGFACWIASYYIKDEYDENFLDEALTKLSRLGVIKEFRGRWKVVRKGDIQDEEGDNDA